MRGYVYVERVCPESEAQRTVSGNPRALMVRALGSAVIPLRALALSRLRKGQRLEMSQGLLGSSGRLP